MIASNICVRNNYFIIRTIKCSRVPIWLCTIVNNRSTKWDTRSWNGSYNCCTVVTVSNISICYNYFIITSVKSCTHMKWMCAFKNYWRSKWDTCSANRSNNSRTIIAVSTINVANYNFIRVAIKSYSVSRWGISVCTFIYSWRTKRYAIVWSIYCSYNSSTIIRIIFICISYNNFITIRIMYNITVCYFNITIKSYRCSPTNTIIRGTYRTYSDSTVIITSCINIRNNNSVICTVIARCNTSWRRWIKSNSST